MKTSVLSPRSLVTLVIVVAASWALVVGCSRSTPPPPTAERTEAAPAPAADTNAAPESAATHGPPPVAAPATNPAAAAAVAPPPPSPGPPASAPPSASLEGASPTNAIQLAFQGANIEMVVQWLAKTTGKSVVKHPRVQCQLTIVSSRPLPPRDAINLVYHALSLEGFNAIESSNAILIVPEGQEPKLSPALVHPAGSDVPEGRQRLIKVFALQHAHAAELRDKIKAVLSDKATVEVDERGNQMIVTDYTENIRLLGELIQELDVASPADTVIEIYSLQHSEADELANLLGLILNAQAAGASPPGRSPSPPPSGPLPPGAPPSPPGVSSAGTSAGPNTGQGQQVRLWADKTSNRLIVSAPRAKLAEVERLLQILDAEKPQDVALRVLPLRHVSAEDLVKEIGPLYQKLSGRSLKDLIEVAFNERSNSLIVLSSAANFEALRKLVATLDTEQAQEQVLKAFPLKNADAEDVARQLEELFREQPAASRYVYYFSAPTGRSARKFSVVADRRRNTVLVQAPPATLESLSRMIAELDEPVGGEGLAPKIYPLKYVSAADIEDVLNELFLKKQPVRSYWDYYYFLEGGDLTEQDAGRLYGKVRITSEPYSNSIIVTANSPESLAAVEEVIRQLDRPSQAGETTLRVMLKFAKASTVANSLNILFAKGGSPPLRPAAPPQPAGQGAPQAQPAGAARSNFELEQEAIEDVYYPWLGGQPETFRSTEGRSTLRPVSDLIGKVRAVPDRRSNSLLITSNVHLFAEVLKLVNELDVPTAQVLIEAKIVEVSSDFRDKLGVRWSPDGSQTFEADDLDNAILGNAGGVYTNVFLGSLLGNSLRTGVLDASLNLDFLVQFLRKTTDARILAEPQINVADNELGRLFVGAQVPFINFTAINPQGSQNQSFEYKNVGIILEVTPHINNEADVALRIRAESSNIRSGATLLGGAILDTRNFRTDLMVKSGQTVVLGGILQREESDVVRKVPLLGSIPGLGWAFKKRDKISREVELMVFLRPKITRSPEEARRLLEDIDRQSPRIKQWREESEPQSAEPPAQTPNG